MQQCCHDRLSDTGTYLNSLTAYFTENVLLSLYHHTMSHSTDKPVVIDGFMSNRKTARKKAEEALEAKRKEVM